MKNLLILSGLLVLLSGCTDDDLLIRKAEKHLKDYLDYPGSYRRISWKVTDTLRVNDFLSEQLKEPLSIQEEKLSALSKNMPLVCEHLSSVRDAIRESHIQGQAARIKSSDIEEARQKLNSDLESFLVDSTDLANELAHLEFSRDSIVNLMNRLENENSAIRQIRLELRFRTKISSNQYGIFCSKMMFAGDEPEILDTYYDGIRLSH
jgi:hypothetical protein